ncbi:MAG: hypothetical protein CSA65_02420 [Proteobacteria bacterium]|nr:MAG: hypothetical protein CSA65_02420 [Pseudomonadota bacterium]
MKPLTTDLDSQERRPYFLWDEDLSVAELRQRLTSGPATERRRLLAKLLREAKDTDVWRFTSPQQVADELDRLGPMLGRRRAFWFYLIEGWRRDGLIR